ncbi:transporter, lactate permease family [Coriobacteriaceae bacterium BV3Ac1]|nr:transporter, lactate permease family [Coriobacteriaceae bacterium BV3Ac1]
MDLLIPFLLGLAPILWLVIALVGIKMPAHLAAAGALLVAAILSLVWWHMPLINMATAALEGIAMAIWPIVIVIIAAVFTYNVTVHTGAIETIKVMLTSVSSHQRVLAVLIAWCFGGFLEGMAGFGTAVAIPSSMMIALGFDPLKAVLVCLVANGTPTMFGSIGIPTTTLAAITGLDGTALALTQALQVAPFVIATPFIIVMIIGDGPRALRGLLPVTLTAGLSMAIPEIATAAVIGGDLPMVVASVVSLIATFFVARATNDKIDVLYPPLKPKEHINVWWDQALRAWCPFILVFIVLVFTSKLVPVINGPLSAIKTTVNIYQGDPTATLSFSWINTPGVLILICGILGAFAQGCEPHEIWGVLIATCKQMSKTILTMLSVLACAKIMGYSGMIASIAAFFVGTFGGFYPLVAPLLGAMGTFVTGSGTSSEVLFGNVQVQAAHSINTNPIWLAASNSVGVSAGKMLSPQNIAIGCATPELAGRDGEVLSRVAPYAFGYAVLMSILTFVGVMLGW